MECALLKRYATIPMLGLQLIMHSETHITLSHVGIKEQLKKISKQEKRKSPHKYILT